MSVLIQCINFDFESSFTTVSGRPLWSGSTPPAAVLCHREGCPSDAQGRLKLDENLHGIDIKLTQLACWISKRQYKVLITVIQIRRVPMHTHNRVT